MFTLDRACVSGVSPHSGWLLDKWPNKNRVMFGLFSCFRSENMAWLIFISVNSPSNSPANSVYPLLSAAPKQSWLLDPAKQSSDFWGVLFSTSVHQREYWWMQTWIHKEECLVTMNRTWSLYKNAYKWRRLERRRVWRAFQQNGYKRTRP